MSEPKPNTDLESNQTNVQFDQKQKEELPLRFRDPSIYNREDKKEHPFYRTSNASYGASAPTQQSLPNVYCGRKGTFTKNFTEFPRNTGLNTSVTKNRFVDT
eukprot:TRINITY_DN649_c0_g1_i1.p1 TRINITY_DN649_c0_g1~~TRINITY_DN649_c0_g1_i1.p1  ORF type:complete len:110 (+),score=11.08 TRINITY_DN649_c0_g1_i1:27-332(+)